MAAAGVARPKGTAKYSKTMPKAQDPVSQPARRFRFGRFEFDAGRGVLAADGEPLAVGQRAAAVLGALLAADGRVVTKAELLDAGWRGLVVEESNLSVQIAALRKALGAAPEGREWIATAARVGYRFAGPVTVEVEGGPSGGATHAPAEGRPAVAVLPFANLGGDPGDDYLADGITEEIITALSRFRWFHVIGRNASFAFRAGGADAGEVARALGARYVLQGNVRRAGRAVRISVHLVDAANARQVWGERYDTELDDLFAVQDRIAEQVVGATEPALLRTESANVARRAPLGDVDAWDRVQRGTALFHRFTRATHLQARELFREARALDPGLPEASIWLARVNAGIVAYGWSDDPDRDLSEGIDAGLLAVQLDERNPYAHYALAITSAYGPDVDRAVRAAEAAVEANPSFALGHLVLGMARVFSGDAQGARAALENGLALNPHDPQNVVWLNLLAHACLFAGDAVAGRDAAIRALKVRPDWRPSFETLACCEAAAGDVPAAQRCAVQWRALPAPSGDALAPMRRNNPEWAALLEAFLGQAGCQ
jgi:TolB-like protein